uniref:Uncharacterized protein n=1 Tax=Populus trichocarpa TaxID=3694 RepID=A0A2K2AKD4_POPTR
MPCRNARGRSIPVSNPSSLKHTLLASALYPLSRQIKITTQLKALISIALFSFCVLFGSCRRRSSFRRQVESINR